MRWQKTIKSLQSPIDNSRRRTNACKRCCQGLCCCLTHSSLCYRNLLERRLQELGTAKADANQLQTTLFEKDSSLQRAAAEVSLVVSCSTIFAEARHLD